MMKTPSINLYSTQSHPCSYLAGQEARTLFVDPQYPVSAETYARFTTLGFRRSGTHIYRPHCLHCHACIPIRVPANHFKHTRQQKRVWLRNQDLRVEISEDIRTGEHYRLYERYITTRHRDGDMFPPSREQFEAFLAAPFFSQSSRQSDSLVEPEQITLYLEFRKDDQLLGVAVTDVLPSGLSAVYTFYDPDDNHRSLGVFSVLFQIELAKKLSLPHLYLGYWIEASKKMSYKKNYQPNEIYLNGQWLPGT